MNAADFFSVSENKITKIETYLSSWIIGSQNGSTLTFGVRNKEKQANYHKLMVIGSYTKSIWRGNGILLLLLFWPAGRKKCASDREKLLKFETEGGEFAKILRSLEQFIWTVKGQANVW